MAIILIGIDDTDVAESPGTGKLARRLSQELTLRGARWLGTTGHQFLIDDRIPYTGHNRGICMGVEWPGRIEQLDFVFDLIREWSAEGSDPGVCIGRAESVLPKVTAWGERALTEVVSMAEAKVLAEESGLNLRGLGGTTGGIIGALASVGLRAGGEHGRIVDMPGLRELGETVTADVLFGMGIEVEHRGAGPVAISELRLAGEAEHGTIYQTLGWVRPELSHGKAVWYVEWSAEHDGWISVDRKKTHPVE